MRELAVRNIATEMGICGALAEPLETWEPRMEILHGRNRHPISHYA